MIEEPIWGKGCSFVWVIITLPRLPLLFLHSLDYAFLLNRDLNPGVCRSDCTGLWVRVFYKIKVVLAVVYYLQFGDIYRVIWFQSQTLGTFGVGFVCFSL